MKYRSLQQVYSESVSGNVPPRRHLLIIGEETRGRKPTDDVQFVLPGMEDDIGAEYHVPKSDKDGAGQAYVSAGETSTLQKLEMATARILGLNKPGKGEMKAISSIIAITQEFVGGGEFNDEISKETLALLNDLGSKKIKIPLPSGAKFDWIDFVADNHPSKYIGPQSKEYIYKLSKLSGSGSVSVGWPEFAGVIFLSDTHKSTEGGDLIRNGNKIEVKATEARMGTGSPAHAFKEMQNILQSNGIKFEKSGSGSLQVWSTLKDSLEKIRTSNLTDEKKKEVTIDILINGTPKEVVYSPAAESFKSWAKNKDIVKLVEDESVLKYIFAAIQILIYWGTDGKKFNSMWAVNNDFDSYVFDITEKTTFEDIFNILIDNFSISKIESDSFYGPVGITVNSKRAQNILKIK